MRVNIIEWLTDKYNFNINLLKKEIKFSHMHKNLGNYSNKKNCSEINGLTRNKNIIDRLFIWNHSDKTFSSKFFIIDQDWRCFSEINKLLDEDVYYDFNFFKKEKLKIKFEGN